LCFSRATMSEIDVTGYYSFSSFSMDSTISKAHRRPVLTPVRASLSMPVL
jgi:hypothetical protein